MMERLTNKYSDGTPFVPNYVLKRTNGMPDVIKKLADYEDLEEQGLLLKLPCKVGDTVYIPIDIDNKIYIGVCNGFTEDKHRGRGALVEIEYADKTKSWEAFSNFGKIVFLTREEAEAKLKEMEGK